jgi:hypothetical protein
MKTLALLAALMFTLNAQAASMITCEGSQFKKCALAFLTASQELKDDVANFLSDDRHAATQKEIADFIKSQYKKGELDLATYGYGDGGDGVGQPAGFIGTMRLGIESQVYEIALSMTNLVYEKDGRRYGKLWKVDQGSAITRVSLIEEKSMDRKNDFSENLKK